MAEFVCYDNEAHMNTGIQRSAATPRFARTNTTQAAGEAPGNLLGTGKNVLRIAMAHGISISISTCLSARAGTVVDRTGIRWSNTSNYKPDSNICSSHTRIGRQSQPCSPCPRFYRLTRHGRETRLRLMYLPTSNGFSTSHWNDSVGGNHYWSVSM